MTDHWLKCHVEFFQATKAGRKRAEVRLNDRNFQRDDRLFLVEWDADDGKETGDVLGPLTVLHVLATDHLAPGYVMLSHSDPIAHETWCDYFSNDQRPCDCKDDCGACGRCSDCKPGGYP